MPRPMMERRSRVRVEFGLSPSLADRLYAYAKCEGLTLSQTGERLLTRALSGEVQHPPVEPDPGQRPAHSEGGPER